MSFFPLTFSISHLVLWLLITHRAQPWALASLQRLHPKLASVPTSTFTPACHHLSPLDSLGGSSSTPLCPKQAAAAQRRQQVAAGARNRVFGMHRPVFKLPFPYSRFKGSGNTSFSCDRFTEVAWCLQVGLCSIQHREAYLALPGKLFHAAETEYCCEAFHSTHRWDLWQKMGVTDCWWGAGEPTDELKFGLESVGGVYPAGCCSGRVSCM